MNHVFPEIYSATLGQIPSGAIVQIPRAEGSLLALVTDQSAKEDYRSIVLLNSTIPNRPRVVFYETWERDEPCLYYKTDLRFEINTEQKDVDTDNHWWTSDGLIISTNNEFLIKASADSRSGFRYVNIQTGTVFSGALPTFFVAFAAWSIWQRDPLHQRDKLILDFEKLASAVRTR